VQRSVVTAPDGTELSVAVTGVGPAVVAVPGLTGTSESFALVARRLKSAHTIVALDRRGTGESDDGSSYALEREFDDVAAVCRFAASHTGGPVVLFGHSFGGLAALGAAPRLGVELAGLVLYEPPVAVAQSVDRDFLARLIALHDAEDWDAVVRLFLSELGATPPGRLAEMAAVPAVWERVVATGPVVRRQVEACTTYHLDPEPVRALAAPILLLTGSETAPLYRQSTDEVSAIVPDARVRTLAGQEHMAILTDPDAVAAAVVEFTAVLGPPSVPPSGTA
jgi:pimeloyl-ACP methyl ester carboxylesterase